ncbi:LysR family transcriptional regulator [Rhodoligotrophos defluvii]|uniref:LysR family transcriptional regulator n=1 Tax=Rhodoligotrophos defluvii TaxID=2561934 RepID=UPI0010CA147A|nr:LysR family transcriptional regulator [Rhodoligotrophos defluvii]
MDLRQIQYFVALYEEKSITKSARRLHVVQPAVSMQIRRIEVDYGVTLFERTSAGVFPNDTAAAIYPTCIEILAQVEKVRQTLRQGSGKLSGRLSVGVPPSIAHGILAPLLLEFRAKHPGVHLAVHEGYSAHLVDWLLQGDLDFAILSEYEEDKRLRRQPIATEELRVVGSTEAAFPGDMITGKQLLDFKLVVPSSKNLIRILLEAEFDRVGLDFVPAMEVDSLATVFATIRDPEWATILPASAIGATHTASGLRSLKLVEPTIRRTLVATFQAHKSSHPATPYFIAALKEAIIAVGGIEATT